MSGGIKYTGSLNVRHYQILNTCVISILEEKDIFKNQKNILRENGQIFSNLNKNNPKFKNLNNL